MNYVINIGDFYRIAGAILNKYREPIVMEGATAEVAEIMLEKSRTLNVNQVSCGFSPVRESATPNSDTPR